METLLKLCCSKLRSSFSLCPYSYYLEVRRCIESIPRLSDLKQDIDDFIGDNFYKIVRSSQFKEFSEADLTTFLSLDSLNVAEEDDVFDCLIAWLQEEEKRKELLPQMWNLIRIPLFTKHKLISLFETFGNCEQFRIRVQEYLLNLFKATPRAGDKLILVVVEEEDQIQLKCFDIKVNLVYSISHKISIFCFTYYE